MAAVGTACSGNSLLALAKLVTRTDNARLLL